MSLYPTDRWPTCDSCGFSDSDVVESRIGRADLHEECVEDYCREHYPEDYDEDTGDWNGVRT